MHLLRIKITVISLCVKFCQKEISIGDILCDNFGSCRIKRAEVNIERLSNIHSWETLI